MSLAADQNSKNPLSKEIWNKRVRRVIFSPVKNDRKSTGKVQNVCFDLVWMSVLETECANDHDNKSVFIELNDIRMARSILRHS